PDGAPGAYFTTMSHCLPAARVVPQDFDVTIEKLAFPVSTGFIVSAVLPVFVMAATVCTIARLTKSFPKSKNVVLIVADPGTCTLKPSVVLAVIAPDFPVNRMLVVPVLAVPDAETITT